MYPSKRKMTPEHGVIFHMLPAGIEPAPPPSEGGILSIGLREQKIGWAIIKFSFQADKVYTKIVKQASQRCRGSP